MVSIPREADKKEVGEGGKREGQRKLELKLSSIHWMAGNPGRTPGSQGKGGRWRSGEPWRGHWVSSSRGCLSSVSDGEAGRLKMESFSGFGRESQCRGPAGVEGSIGRLQAEVGGREWWGLRPCGRARWD